jgi:hypothetical protein
VLPCSWKKNRKFRQLPFFLFAAATVTYVVSTATLLHDISTTREHIQVRRDRSYDASRVKSIFELDDASSDQCTDNITRWRFSYGSFSLFIGAIVVVNKAVNEDLRAVVVYTTAYLLGVGYT